MSDIMDRMARRTNFGQNQSADYQRFKGEYFSGGDARIYFGDVWVDEITNLQFSLQEQVSPIFGYASYTWDKVARGTRYIQGSFTINFKESYYLHSVLNSLRSKQESAGQATNEKSVPKATSWTNDLTVEQLLEGKFEAVADEFEKALWGEGDRKAYARQRSTKSSYFTSESTDSRLNDEGFNILLAYGPMNEAGGMDTNQTVRSLMGVHLTGCGQIISGDGQPIQEQYSFIARDLDGDTSTW